MFAEQIMSRAHRLQAEIIKPLEKQLHILSIIRRTTYIRASTITTATKTLQELSSITVVKKSKRNFHLLDHQGSLPRERTSLRQPRTALRAKKVRKTTPDRQYGIICYWIPAFIVMSFFTE